MHIMLVSINTIRYRCFITRIKNALFLMLTKLSFCFISAYLLVDAVGVSGSTDLGVSVTRPSSCHLSQLSQLTGSWRAGRQLITADGGTWTKFG